MKKSLVFVITAFLIASCNQNDSITKDEESPEEVKSIKGKYVRVDHIQIKSASDAVGGFGLISEITFHEKNCEFLYFGIPMSGSYELDGRKIFINAGGQIGNLSMTLLDGNKLQGSGFINGIFMNQKSKEYIDYKERTKDLYFSLKTIPLRILPSIKDGKICDTLFEGHDVKIIEENKSWVLVENKEEMKFGWCRKASLEKY